MNKRRGTDSGCLDRITICSKKERGVGLRSIHHRSLKPRHAMETLQRSTASYVFKKPGKHQRRRQKVTNESIFRS